MKSMKQSLSAKRWSSTKNSVWGCSHLGSRAGDDIRWHWPVWDLKCPQSVHFHKGVWAPHRTVPAKTTIMAAESSLAQSQAKTLDKVGMLIAKSAWRKSTKGCSPAKATMSPAQKRRMSASWAEFMRQQVFENVRNETSRLLEKSDRACCLLV